MLARGDVKQIRARFEEDRQQFADLALAAEGFLARALRDAQIRHVLSSRAKGVPSLERKLWNDREKWSPSDFRDGLSPPLKDLAAARVITYVERDIAPAVDAIVKAVGVFGRLYTDPVTFDKTNRPEGYRAVHLHVARPDGPPCEVQVCTVTAHLWNELDHDIRYKQHDRKADDVQQNLLFALRGALHLSANIARRLMDHTAARIAESDEAFDGPDSLRRFLEAHEGHVVIRGDFAAMFGLLDGLVKPFTPKMLHQMLDAGMKVDAASALCSDLDPDGAQQDVGRILVRTLQSIAPDAVDAFVADDGPSLHRFARRASRRIHEGGGG